MAKPGLHQRRPSAREFSASDAYNRLIYIIQNSSGMKEAANRLDRSPRTLRRWKSEGIPDRALFKNDKKLEHKINRVFGGLKGAETRLERSTSLKPHPKKEPRITYYIRTYAGGARVIHYPVENLPFEAMLEILMRDCLRQPRTVAYTFLLKFESPFSGMWDGETFTSERDLTLMPKSQAQVVRNTGSWINITMSDPFVSTRLIDFKDTCSYDQIGDVLSKYFYLENTKIYEIRVKERRSWTDAQDEADYDY